MDEFLFKNNIELQNLKIYEDQDNCMSFLDKNIESDWIKYHDSIAVFRILCPCCNRTLGSKTTI